MENSLSEKRIGALTQYCGIMVALLVIGYILIITNPPSNLLLYDNGKSFTVYLSWSNMSSYGGPLVIFMAMFSLLSFLIGLLTSIIRWVEAEPRSSLIFYGTSAVSVIVLSLLVYPYYGADLAVTLMAEGIPVYFMGWFFAPSARARRIYHTFIFSMSSLLAELVVIIWLFIHGILPISVAIILLLLAAFLWGFANGFALEAIMKGIQNYWRGKRGKKHVVIEK